MPRSKTAISVFVLLMGAPCLSSQNEEVLLDEVVAVVNSEVITHSELVQEARLILVQREGEAGLTKMLTTKFLEDVLELLVNQRLILQEAQRAGLETITMAERQRLIEGFSLRFADRQQYQRFLYREGISEEEIADVLSRHLLVERMKEYKLRSLPAIGNEDIERYYQDHRVELGGRSLAVLAEAIRLKLITDQRREFLSRWLSQLRRQARLRVMVSFTGQQEAGEK